MDDTIVYSMRIDLVVTSGGALNKSQKQTQSFVVDIGKQMKMGDHLVKLLPPSQKLEKEKEEDDVGEYAREEEFDVWRRRRRSQYETAEVPRI